jgi:hypothetical protein
MIKKGNIPWGCGSVQWHGTYWLMVYRDADGNRRQENSYTTDRKKAERILAERSLAVLESMAAQLRRVISGETRNQRTGGDATVNGSVRGIAARRIDSETGEAAR